MFIGRKKELSILEDAYRSGTFEFLVLYGRRRIGKTALLQEFSLHHKTLLYSAQEKNDPLNLLDFSKAVQHFFEGRFFGEFSDWEAAFGYISGKADSSERLVLIIDEFPFIAAENPSIKSILQHAIDCDWKEKNIFLILCGSSVSFMEDEVLAHKSPLYGRSTVHMKLKGFDYLESSQFFPGYTNAEKITAYCILGGVPCYLAAFDANRPPVWNVASKILREGAFLKDEPSFLLRQELREPAVYNSIFEVIAGGATRVNDIASKIHEEPQKCSKYLRTLQAIRLVKKCTPCGEDESSRKTVYKISDNYFSFWYHFLFGQKSYYELLGEERAAEEIFQPENFNAYAGRIFEDVCTEYMLRCAGAGRLPFVPAKYGRWWGSNPERKTQDDIDILLIDRTGRNFIICECKFRNDVFDKRDFETMLSRRSVFPRAREISFFAFSRNGFSDWVTEHADRDRVTLVGIDDLFTFFQ